MQLSRMTTLLAVAAMPWVHGCSGTTHRKAATNLTERDCLVRAMYFESNRSSHDGLMAVGTVVMNRVDSPRFPETVCGVVGQPRQFARGVLTQPIDPRQAHLAGKAADAVLAGERYAPVGEAMHFHMASYKNPYPARYVTVVGGNAFYLKPGHRLRRQDTTGSIAADSPADDAPMTGVVRRLYERASPVPSSG